MEETKTTELDKVKPEKVTLMIHGKEREIKFSFSVWGKIEKEHGGFNNFEEAITNDLTNKPFETLPHLIFIALKDKSAYKDEKGKEYPEVTEENILDDYGLQDIEYITDVFNRALYGSLPLENDEKKAEQEA